MEFSRVQVLRGSCLAQGGLPSLPDDSIDCIITDPPYAKRIHQLSRRGHTGYVEKEKRARATFSRNRELGFAHITARMRTLCAQQYARLAKRWTLVFCDLESDHLWAEALQAAGLEWVRTMGWVKEGATPQFTGDRPAAWAEAIVLAHRPGRKRWNGGGRHGVYSVPIVLNRGDSGEQRVHTTQKPLLLMEALVRDFTNHGELVCDPFTGSGTTGVAALKHGRRFLGYERDRKYHAIAQDRLRLTREQLTLFSEAPAPSSTLDSPVRHSFADIDAAMRDVETELAAIDATATDGLVAEITTKEQGHGM